MVINKADNIMLGSQEVDRVYLGSNLVWQRKKGGDFYPHTDGVVGYFDCDNASADTWYNKIGSDNFNFVFGTQATQNTDSLQLAGNSCYNFAPSEADLHSSVTIYMIAKNVSAVSSSSGQYFCTSITGSGGGGIEVASGWGVTNTLALRSLSSKDWYTDVNVLDYKVIALTANAINSTYRLFIDGELYGEQANYTAVSTKNYINLMARDTSFKSQVDTLYKHMSIANVIHSDEQIIANSKYLINKFL